MVYSSCHFIPPLVARQRAIEVLFIVCARVRGSLLFLTENKNVVILMSLSPGRMFVV